VICKLTGTRAKLDEAMTPLGTLIFEHDGTELVGEVAVPCAPGPHPAVLVMHTAHGLSDLMRERARQLANLGYLAVATDMYGGRECDTGRALDGSLMMGLVNVPGRLRARCVAWYDQVKQQSDVDTERVAAIGFCFGGMCVLELARSGVDVKAVISYHGLLTTPTPAAVGAIQGQVAIYTGARDPYAPSQHVETLRQEMIAAQSRFQITVFSDACHAFTDPHAGAIGRPGIAYDVIADRVSWAGTVALLESTIGNAERHSG
jgi:dienelactone hydrolase